VIGVMLYQVVEHYVPGAGPWVLVLPLLLVTLGAIGFVRMSRDMRAEAERAQAQA
jgi:ABC-type dipeptide/oligopeptide/nickel transport system permease subunit